MAELADTSPVMMGRSGTTRRSFVTGGLVLAGIGLGAGRAFALDAGDFFAPRTDAAGTSMTHERWSQLLATYVKPGADGLNRVDYRGWKAQGRAELAAYLSELAAVDPRQLSRSQQYAYWANLYNAKTIDVVLDAYPVESIKKISLGGSLLSTFTGGPWDAKVVTIAGQDLTLNNIEHDIMRPGFGDPRVHYAVNCASVGCPNLGTSAFEGPTLEAQLEAGATAYVNSARGVSFTGGELTASSIYDWFAEDFGGDEAGVLSHLRKYAEGATGEALARAKTIDDYHYDWSLNDVAG
ncbi:MAG: DUF547 domain-containing protein [Rhizobiales bacterium]|nr:DUF547 domain-containing protein [Hyphomicrobiales bacterium]